MTLLMAESTTTQFSVETVMTCLSVVPTELMISSMVKVVMIRLLRAKARTLFQVASGPMFSSIKTIKRLVII